MNIVKIKLDDKVFNWEIPKDNNLSVISHNVENSIAAMLGSMFSDIANGESNLNDKKTYIDTALKVLSSVKGQNIPEETNRLKWHPDNDKLGTDDYNA
jgi:hypothetical protein